MLVCVFLEGKEWEIRGRRLVLARTVSSSDSSMCRWPSRAVCSPMCDPLAELAQQHEPFLPPLNLTKWEGFSWNHQEIINMDRVVLRVSHTEQHFNLSTVKLS